MGEPTGRCDAEAPEAFDDVAMCAGVGEVAFEGLAQWLWDRVTQGLEQLHAACLQGAVLGMLKRQIEEGPLDRTQLPIQAALDAVEGPGARPRIGFERGGRVAVNVATELVHQDDPRQHTLRRVTPFVQAALACCRDDGAEAHRDLGIQFGTLAKPQGGMCAQNLRLIVRAAEPELEHFARQHLGHALSHSRMPVPMRSLRLRTVARPHARAAVRSMAEFR